MRDRMMGRWTFMLCLLLALANWLLWPVQKARGQVGFTPMGSSVMVGTNGVVALPPGFWTNNIIGLGDVDLSLDDLGRLQIDMLFPTNMLIPTNVSISVLWDEILQKPTFGSMSAASTSDYYTASDTDQIIAGILSDYYSTSAVDALLAGYVQTNDATYLDTFSKAAGAAQLAENNTFTQTNVFTKRISTPRIEFPVGSTTPRIENTAGLFLQIYDNEENAHIFSSGIFGTQKIQVTDSITISGVQAATVDDLAPYVQTNHTGNVEIEGNLKASGAIAGATANISGNLVVDTDTLFVNSVTDRIGIGMSPTATLSIQCGAHHSAGIRLKSASSGYWDIYSVFSQSDADLIFFSSGTERARFKKDGNFGLGVVNPLHKLHVNGNALVTGTVTHADGTLATHSATVGQLAGYVATNHMGNVSIDGQLTSRYSARRTAYPITYASNITVSVANGDLQAISNITGNLTITWPQGNAIYDEMVRLLVYPTTNQVIATNGIQTVYGDEISTNQITPLLWYSPFMSTNANLYVYPETTP